jgi:FtsH-binding integral membrane protein
MTLLFSSIEKSMAQNSVLRFFFLVPLSVGRFSIFPFLKKKDLLKLKIILFMDDNTTSF